MNLKERVKMFMFDTGAKLSVFSRKVQMRVTYYYAWMRNEDMRQEGFDEGIEKGICALIQTSMELGISDDIIVEKCAEKYEMTKETVGIYMEECCA